MREDGLPVDDFLIIPGVEVTTAEGTSPFCIGDDASVLKGKPAPGSLEIIHEARRPRHPAAPLRPLPGEDSLPRAGNIADRCPRVFNAATTLRRYNRYAFQDAQLRGFPMTASSDVHHADAVGTAYTILNTDDFSSRWIAQLVKNNDLNQDYLTPRNTMRKTWNNWLRLRRRKKLPLATTQSERRQRQQVGAFLRTSASSDPLGRQSTGFGRARLCRAVDRKTIGSAERRLPKPPDWDSADVAHRSNSPSALGSVTGAGR